MLLPENAPVTLYSNLNLRAERKRDCRGYGFHSPGWNSAYCTLRLHHWDRGLGWIVGRVQRKKRIALRTLDFWIQILLRALTQGMWPFALCHRLQACLTTRLVDVQSFLFLSTAGVACYCRAQQDIDKMPRVCIFTVWRSLI